MNGQIPGEPACLRAEGLEPYSARWSDASISPEVEISITWDHSIYLLPGVDCGQSVGSIRPVRVQRPTPYGDGCSKIQSRKVH